MKTIATILLLIALTASAAVQSPKAGSFTSGTPMVRTSSVAALPATNIWNIPLAWNASPGAVLYHIYYGVASRIYTNFVVSSTTNATVSAPDSSDLYMAVTAVNSIGLESDFSNEVTTAPPQNRIVRFFVDTATNISGPWTFFTNVWTATNPPASKFFRMNYSIEYFY